MSTVFDQGWTDMQTAIGLQECPNQLGLRNEQVQANRSPRALSVATDAVGSAGFLRDLSRQQISDSLQRLRFSESPAALPAPDPYPAIRISVITLDGGAKQVHHAAEVVSEFEAISTPALVATPKVVASFVGRVESLSGESANVLLINDQTGERLESRCDAEVLRENGLAAGDAFRCEVVRCKGTTSTRLSRLPSKRLPIDRVEQIRAGFKGRWTF